MDIINIFLNAANALYQPFMHDQRGGGNYAPHSCHAGIN